MNKPQNRGDLLAVCIQDLHAGAVAVARRLPAIASAITDPELGEVCRAIGQNAAADAMRLRSTGVDVDGPANLWMDGILSDAERDRKDERAGVLRDIALTGAGRKLLAARIVSDDTAMLLARATGADAILEAVSAERAEAVAADGQLHAILARLAATGKALA